MDSDLVKEADKLEQENVNRFFEDHRHERWFDDSTKLRIYLALKEPWRNEE